MKPRETESLYPSPIPYCPNSALLQKTRDTKGRAGICPLHVPIKNKCDSDSLSVVRYESQDYPPHPSLGLSSTI